MQNFNQVFSGTEKTVFELRQLYGEYGYKKYRMSKFEKYDLYAKNKDFLVSDNVITFTDTDGTLMALKPDVTLSIIKNGKDGVGLEKVYYNESVYRVGKGTRSFKEFMQVGLECFGDIDDYAISEVLYLAVKSLEKVSTDYILTLSDLDLVNAILSAVGLSQAGSKKVLELLAEKNAHGITEVCKEENIGEENAETVKKLVTVYGDAKKVIAQLKALNLSQIAKPLNQLENILSFLEDMGVLDKVKIDFSVVSDINYYNGIVFKGFVSGIPTSIISGGQYDSLMKKMKRQDKAIGFAVYLDEIEKFVAEPKVFDVDVAIEYGENCDIKLINEKVKKAKEQGERVFVAKKLPEKLTFKRLIDLKGGKN